MSTTKTRMVPLETALLKIIAGLQALHEDGEHQQQQIDRLECVATALGMICLRLISDRPFPQAGPEREEVESVLHKYLQEMVVENEGVSRN